MQTMHFVAHATPEQLAAFEAFREQNDTLPYEPLKERLFQYGIQKLIIDKECDFFSRTTGEDTGLPQNLPVGSVYLRIDFDPHHRACPGDASWKEESDLTGLGQTYLIDSAISALKNPNSPMFYPEGGLIKCLRVAIQTDPETTAFRTFFPCNLTLAGENANAEFLLGGNLDYDALYKPLERLRIDALNAKDPQVGGNLEPKTLREAQLLARGLLSQYFPEHDPQSVKAFREGHLDWPSTCIGVAQTWHSIMTAKTLDDVAKAIDSDQVGGDGGHLWSFMEFVDPDGKGFELKDSFQTIVANRQYDEAPVLTKSRILGLVEQNVITQAVADQLFAVMPR